MSPTKFFRQAFASCKRPLIPMGLALVPQLGFAAYTTIIDNGPSSNRIDIVFLGDGYRASEIETTYVSHINGMLNHMFGGSQQPFVRYSKYFNVHRVNVISAESGADRPNDGVFRNTALDASYYFDGVTQRVLYVNDSKAEDALFAGVGNGFADMKFLTVNDTVYGGGGGRYAVFAGGNASAPEIALHEIAHSFSGLADEYGGFGLYTGGELQEPNVTIDPTGARWAHWLGYQDSVLGPIGAYQGGAFFDQGVYRPSFNSKLRTLGRPFDAVAREQFILDFYALVDPLDSWTDNSQTLTNPGALMVDAIDPAIIDIAWYVNGILVPGATGESFSLLDYGFGPGAYEVVARARDSNPDLVRINLGELEQSIAWSVVHSVPVPAAAWLFGSALLGALGLRRRSLA